MTKPTRTAKTLIRLGGCPGWSESSLSAWRNLGWVGSLTTHWAHSKDTYKTWADAQADLGLCWAHTHFIGFVMSLPIKRTAKTLIRLGECPGWSESSLVAQAILLVLSYWGSHVVLGTQTRRQWGETIIELPHDKTNKMSVRPAKTQISLGISQVWSETSLSAWRNLGSLTTHWAHSKDTDQTWADAQADLSLRWAHTHFVDFVTSRLIYFRFFWVRQRQGITGCVHHIIKIRPRIPWKWE